MALPKPHRRVLIASLFLPDTVSFELDLPEPHHDHDLSPQPESPIPSPRELESFETGFDAVGGGQDLEHERWGKPISRNDSGAESVITATGTVTPSHDRELGGAAVTAATGGTTKAGGHGKKMSTSAIPLSIVEDLAAKSVGVSRVATPTSHLNDSSNPFSNAHATALSAGLLTASNVSLSQHKQLDYGYQNANRTTPSSSSGLGSPKLSFSTRGGAAAAAAAATGTGTTTKPAGEHFISIPNSQTTSPGSSSPKRAQGPNHPRSRVSFNRREPIGGFAALSPTSPPDEKVPRLERGDSIVRHDKHISPLEHQHEPIGDVNEKPVQRRSRHSYTFRPGPSGPRPGRSGSRARSVSLSPSERLYSTAPFNIEPNPRGNIGLQHAVACAQGLGAFEGTKGSGVRGKVSKEQTYWIGTVGCPTDSLTGQARDGIVRKLREERNSFPVLVTDDEFAGAYDMFCKQLLWGTFHYQIPDASKTKAYDSDFFEQYKAVNRKFANVIVENHREGDTIWINDYHLLLVPAMVREALPNASIGFFLHIAFPSSEIFRCLAVRKELLKGMLGADLIGFQTYNFARHFRQTVSRICQYQATPKGIQTETGFAQVGVYPIGIDVHSLNQKRKEQEVCEWVRLLQERYADKKLIVGRDKLDYVKGVRQKLLAFEKFLEQHPEWQGKVVLIQVALATSEENEHQVKVTDVVARINARFSSLTYQPVVFLHQDVSFGQYLALLTVADAFLNSSLREGMNLTSHEYVICQDGKFSPLILSEFTGTYSYSGFRSCIPTNPWDFNQCAEAINQALTMEQQEAASRWKELEQHVYSQTARHWVDSFLARLARATLEQHRREQDLIPTLNVSSILPELRQSSNRLILLDLEGTLYNFDPVSEHRQGQAVPEEVFEILEKISAEPQNTVYLLSGKSISDLAVFEKRMPGLGLVAENGCFIKFRNVSTWTNLTEGMNLDWRQPIKEMLNYYTERTPESFVEDRGVSICWRYPSGSPGHPGREWAVRQASEVQNHIMDSLGERYNLHIFAGATSFLVMPKRASRAAAVWHILQSGNLRESLSSAALSGPSRFIQSRSFNEPLIPEATFADVDSHVFDYVLSIGEDDRLFTFLHSLDLSHLVTCSVGGKAKSAAFDVEGPDQVVKALGEVVAAHGWNPTWPI